MSGVEDEVVQNTCQTLQFNDNVEPMCVTK